LSDILSNGYAHTFYANYNEVAREMMDVDPVGFEKGLVVVTGVQRSGDDDGQTCGFKQDQDEVRKWEQCGRK
jgi:hypothetical protein